MSKQERQFAMAQVTTIVHLMQMLPAVVLENALEQSELGDILGPMLDPAAWMEGHELEERLRDVVRAVLDFRRRLIDAGIPPHRS